MFVASVDDPIGLMLPGVELRIGLNVFGYVVDASEGRTSRAAKDINTKEGSRIAAGGGAGKRLTESSGLEGTRDSSGVEHDVFGLLEHEYPMLRLKCPALPSCGPSLNNALQAVILDGPAPQCDPDD